MAETRVTVVADIPQTLSIDSGAGFPAYHYNGAIYTGAAPFTPHLLYDTPLTVTPALWNAAGTYLAVNLHAAFAGDYYVLSRDGVKDITLSPAGIVLAGAIQAAGNIQTVGVLSSQAAVGTTMLQLGPVAGQLAYVTHNATANRTFTLPDVSGIILTSANPADLPIIPVAKGGLGASTATLAQGQFVLGAGAGAYTYLAQGAAGQVLTSAGAAATPTWATPAAGNTGTVTSVSLTTPGVIFQTPVSGSGGTAAVALALALQTQAANTGLYGPTTGVAATPTFRALVAADIPSLDTAKIGSGTFALARLSGLTTAQLSATAGILGSQLDAAAALASGQITSLDAAKLTGAVALARLSGITTTQLDAAAGIAAGQIASVNPSGLTGSGTVPPGGLPSATALALGAVKIGSGVAVAADGTISVTAGGSGTVTSVGLSVPASDLHTVAGSPVTGAGTLALSKALNVAQNAVAAGPASGGPGVWSLRALVAADIPVLPYAGLSGIPSSFTPVAHGATHSAGGSDALSGLTGAQLAAAAGIVAAQIASVNPSTLTGSGTIPVAALSGITTTQISATAGILAAQIASVTPTTLTGAGTVPAAALGLTTAGDIIYGGVAGAPTRLGIGTASQVLLGGASAPAWGGVPDAALSANVALLSAAGAQQFTGPLGIRAALGAVANGLYVPWITGDTHPALVAGASTTGNTQQGINGASDSATGVLGTSNSGSGVVGTSGAGPGVFAQVIDASATTVPVGLIVEHVSSAAATAGLGIISLWRAKSSTTPSRNQFGVQATWVVPTDASRTSRAQWFVYDTAAREALRMEASGTAPMIGFLGAAAQARPAVPIAAIDATTTQSLVNAIRTILINFGLAV